MRHQTFQQNPAILHRLLVGHPRRPSRTTRPKQQGGTRPGASRRSRSKPNRRGSRETPRKTPHRESRRTRMGSWQRSPLDHRTTALRRSPATPSQDATKQDRAGDRPIELRMLAHQKRPNDTTSATLGCTCESGSCRLPLIAIRGCLFTALPRLVLFSREAWGVLPS
jgi:hypothetical protein